MSWQSVVLVLGLVGEVAGLWVALAWVNGWSEAAKIRAQLRMLVEPDAGLVVVPSEDER
ncbi:MAG TPA: hypothetical protein VH834_18155 [Solirubrobacteraceae bacterium]